MKDTIIRDDMTNIDATKSRRSLRLLLDLRARHVCYLVNGLIEMEVGVSCFRIY